MHRSKAAASGRHAGHTIADIGHGQTAETLDDIPTDFPQPGKNPEPYCHIPSPKADLKPRPGAYPLPILDMRKCSVHLIFRTSLQNMRFSMGEQEVYSNRHRVSEAGEQQIDDLVRSLPTELPRFPWMLESGY